jgi:hypothetical protein
MILEPELRCGGMLDLVEATNTANPVELVWFYGVGVMRLSRVSAL